MKKSTKIQILGAFLGLIATATAWYTQVLWIYVFAFIGLLLQFWSFNLQNKEKL